MEIGERKAVTLSDMPGEIMNMIYAHLLISPIRRGARIPRRPKFDADGHIISPCATWADHINTKSSNVPADFDHNFNVEARNSGLASIHAAISMVNRQMNREAEYFLYEKNAFHVIVSAEHIARGKFAGIKFPQSPNLFDHPLARWTTDWRVTLDFDAGLDDDWACIWNASGDEVERQWHETVFYARSRARVLTERAYVVCELLRGLPLLEKILITVRADCHWQLMENVVGVGIWESLKAFEGLTGIRHARVDTGGCVNDGKTLRLTERMMARLETRSRRARQEVI